MIRLHRAAALSLAIAATAVALSPAADRGLGDLKTIRVIPRSEDEISYWYDRSRGNSCEAIPSGEPLEITGFMPCLTDRDRQEWNRGVLLLPSCRRNLFSIGLEVANEDRARLPIVSGSQILRYLRDHYVAVQARVQKDPLDGKLFLHHRPLAVTMGFGRAGLTEDFTEATLAAVRDFRSLGLHLPGDQPQTPENLRTLVLLFKSVLLLPAEPSGKLRLKPKIEFVFIRGRESTVDGPNRTLELHAFATSDQRTRLHYLKDWSAPRLAGQCGVRADVLFLEYSTLGLVPTKSATRNVQYDTRTSFTWEELDERARERHWQGDSLDNLSQTLDGIIDGQISPSEAGER